MDNRYIYKCIELKLYTLASFCFMSIGVSVESPVSLTTICLYDMWNCHILATRCNVRILYISGGYCHMFGTIYIYTCIYIYIYVYILYIIIGRTLIFCSCFTELISMFLRYIVTFSWWHVLYILYVDCFKYIYMYIVKSSLYLYNIYLYTYIYIYILNIYIYIYIYICCHIYIVKVNFVHNNTLGYVLIQSNLIYELIVDIS